MMHRNLCLLLFFGLAVRANVLQLVDAPAIRADLLRLENTTLMVRPVWAVNEAAIPVSKAVEWFSFSRQSPVEFVPDTRVVLRNGDVLHGQIVMADQDTLRLRVAWGEEIGVRVPFLERVEFLPPRENVIVEDDPFVPGWSVMYSTLPPEKLLQRVAGDLRRLWDTRSALSRRFQPLPNVFRMDLSIRMFGRDSSYNLHMNTRPSVDNQGSLILNYGSSILTLSSSLGAVGQGGGISHQVRLPPSAQFHHRFQLYGNAETRRFQLWLNGAKLHEWSVPVTDPGVFPRLEGIVLNGPDQSSSVIEDFRVVSGALPPIDESMAKPDKRLYTLLLRNGDAMRGEWMAATPDAVQFSIPESGSVSIPVRAIDRVLSPGTGPRPRRQPRDVEVRMASPRDRLTLALAELNEQNLRGTCEAFLGPLTIPRAHIALIRFNIYGDAPDGVGRAPTGGQP